MSQLKRGDVPLGFGMALAQAPSALAAFGRLNEKRQSEILKKAGTVQSKEEMAGLVRSIVNESKN